MGFKDDVKMMRINANLTQQELADMLYVTRQTVSTWETGKNMPNLETLRRLSQIFGVTLEQLLFGEELVMVKKEPLSLAKQIDQDVKLKKRYRLWALGLGGVITAVAVVIGILLFGYYKGIGEIDRINPFLQYKTGYAKLASPKAINPNNKNNGYWTAWFSDNLVGNEWTKLSLTTGLNPGMKNPYVIAYHKGSFVKKARIIPGKYVNKMVISNVTAMESMLKDGHNNIATNVMDNQDFKNKVHLNRDVSQLFLE